MNLPNMKQARLRTDKKVEFLDANNIKSDKFKNKKYFIRTYGCQMNVHDSEEIKGILENLGFRETTDLEKSDIIVLNTCAIRENAHDKVFGFLGRCKHLKKETREIVKKRMNTKERFLLFIIAIILCSIAIGVIKYFKGSSPLFDGITTVLSIFGMYLTVKRCIEQWIIWMIVNGLSSIMWLNLVLHGAKTYATFIMWCVYFILAIYFYIQWKKEIDAQDKKNQV